MSVTGLVAKENVMSTAASLLHLVDATETDPSLWACLLYTSFPLLRVSCRDSSPR